VRTKVQLNDGILLQAIWDNPETLLQYFKRCPNEMCVHIARAGETYDSVIEIVQNHLDQESGRY